MPFIDEINSLLDCFQDISLKELDTLKLMNRLDTKYVMPAHKIPALLKKAMENYVVVQIDGQKAMGYKTCYIDTTDRQLYINHQNGRLNRFKIRYRTYLSTNSTFLEIKRKTNKGKTLKSRIQVEQYGSLSDNDISFMGSKVNLPQKPVEVAMENHFYRITLASFKTNERITIDFGLGFSNSNNQVEMPQICIVELKREKTVGKTPMQLILKNLSVYQRGFSKYCMGMALLNPGLKQNSFKMNKLFIKKIIKNYVTN